MKKYFLLFASLIAIANHAFAASADYRLAEARDGQWRIYLKAKSPRTN